MLQVMGKRKTTKKQNCKATLEGKAKVKHCGRLGLK
jgi:hypothetical protein